MLQVHSIVSKGPGITKTKELQREHSQQAMQVLQCFPDNDARTALTNIIVAMGEIWPFLYATQISDL